MCRIAAEVGGGQASLSLAVRLGQAYQSSLWRQRWDVFLQEPVLCVEFVKARLAP